MLVCFRDITWGERGDADATVTLPFPVLQFLWRKQIPSLISVKYRQYWLGREVTRTGSPFFLPCAEKEPPAPLIPTHTHTLTFLNEAMPCFLWKQLLLPTRGEQLLWERARHGYYLTLSSLPLSPGIAWLYACWGRGSLLRLSLRICQHPVW